MLLDSSSSWDSGQGVSFRRIDWWTVVLYVLLLAAGWFSIYGASYDFGQTEALSWTSVTGKQLVWIGGAWILAFVLLMLDERMYDSFAIPFYLMMMGLLLLTIFVAGDIKGSRSWLTFGSLSLQPAEFAKCATALALAKYMSAFDFTMRRGRDVCMMAGIVLLPLLLIIGQRETGSALVYLSFLLMFYREGMPGSVLYMGVCAAAYFLLTIRYGGVYLFGETTPVGMFSALLFALASVCGMCRLYVPRQRRRGRLIPMRVIVPVLAVGLGVCWLVPFDFTWFIAGLLCVIGGYLLYLWLFKHLLIYLFLGLFAWGSVGFVYSSDYLFGHVLEAHQQIRIKILLGMEDDPSGAGYNVRQSLIAIGSGGLTGKGFLNGTQTKLKYVPEQETDFIFCTIGEEEGFVGCVAVLLLYVLLILRVMALAERNGKRFVQVYGYCVAGIFSFHLFINVGMVLGLTPVIGIPLPFLSYGGSSLWGFTLLLFILLRLDAARKR
jgi:rod shape determining protein RodA